MTGFNQSLHKRGCRRFTHQGFMSDPNRVCLLIYHNPSLILNPNPNLTLNPNPKP